MELIETVNAWDGIPQSRHAEANIQYSKVKGSNLRFVISIHVTIHCKRRKETLKISTCLAIQSNKAIKLNENVFNKIN